VHLVGTQKVVLSVDCTKYVQRYIQKRCSFIPDLQTQTAASIRFWSTSS